MFLENTLAHYCDRIQIALRHLLSGPGGLRDAVLRAITAAV